MSPLLSFPLNPGGINHTFPCASKYIVHSAIFLGILGELSSPWQCDFINGVYSFLCTWHLEPYPAQANCSICSMEEKGLSEASKVVKPPPLESWSKLKLREICITLPKIPWVSDKAGI